MPSKKISKYVLCLISAVYLGALSDCSTLYAEPNTTETVAIVKEIDIQFDQLDNSCKQIVGAPKPGCDLEISSYCRFLSMCMSPKATSGGVGGQASGLRSTQSGSTDLKLKVGITGDKFSAALIEYLCLKKYACPDSSK